LKRRSILSPTFAFALFVTQLACAAPRSALPTLSRPFGAHSSLKGESKAGDVSVHCPRPHGERVGRGGIAALLVRRKKYASCECRSMWRNLSSLVIASAAGAWQSRRLSRNLPRLFGLHLGVLDIRGTCLMDCRVASLLAMTRRGRDVPCCYALRNDKTLHCGQLTYAFRRESL
jgi:hypothetical protein